ncbi:MAG: ribosome-associated translation inhibitor RaiA [Chlorobiaceae bacterium]|nr:ribosome-associated translation inhibitor RaiA [Chlorobiaceae bacterium]NTW74904.1 ribosome-associated translation inhibitor RaiA [Chlorobiaceae bacterium]
MTQSFTNDSVAVKVTLRHSSNHNSIEGYAQDAAAGLTKFFPGPMNCHVILDHQKNDYEQNKIAEITVHVPQHDFVARESGQAYEQAIDSCIESLTRQLKKYKEKQRSI